MLHTYRKTATIQAEQFDGSDDMMEKYAILTDSGFVTPNHWSQWFVLPTKEGNMNFDKGDYIATGVDGEQWAIDQDIFERTYERVD